MAETDFARLATFDARSKAVNIVIETSKGSRTKFKYDQEHKMFRTEKALPVGLVFPFDFSFLPSTVGGDGDPLDVLVVSETGFPWGCVVLGNVLEQSENGHKERNDRLIELPLDTKSREPMQPSIAFNSELKAAITEFFIKYNEMQGKKFRVLGFHGPDRAALVIQSGIETAKRKAMNRTTLIEI
jgi:inorganic pyrophosphatase